MPTRTPSIFKKMPRASASGSAIFANSLIQFTRLTLFFFFLAILAQAGIARAQIYQVTSPRNFERIYSFPVKVTVRFGQEVLPETFEAWLNDIPVTHKFLRSPDSQEATAMLSVEDGLRMEIQTRTHGEVNELKTRAHGLRMEQDLEVKIYFFIAVDKLEMVGSKGAKIGSPDGILTLTVPPGAVNTETPIAMTMMPSGNFFGQTYRLSPEQFSFAKPVTVSSKYDPAKLPPGIRDYDLFLLSNDHFPRKLSQITVDNALHTVTGSTTRLGHMRLSYFEKIGKQIKDIPSIERLGLPFGHKHQTMTYSCGLTPFASGQALSLTENLALKRLSHPSFDYPAIEASYDGQALPWKLTTAFNRNRFINTPTGPAADTTAFYNGQGETFSNGEDWLPQNLANGADSPILASADGLVIYNGKDDTGTTTVLAHKLPAGIVLTTYAHLSSSSPCQVGTIVSQGSFLGIVRSSGEDTPYLHYSITKSDIIRIDYQSGDIQVPATWYQEWQPDEIYEHFYDPTNFLLSISGKSKWDFDIIGDDEGWVVDKGQKYESGHVYRVRDGELRVKPTPSGLKMESYPLRVETDLYDSLLLKIKTTGIKGDLRGHVYFITQQDTAYSDDKHEEFVIHNDGGAAHEYSIFLGDNEKWRRTVSRIRVEVAGEGIGESSELHFDYIRFGRSYMSKVPDTGQAVCFDEVKEIPCPSVGQPFFGQDANYADNTPSFAVKQIGDKQVVADLVTGLMWQQKDDGTKRTWQDAADYTSTLAILTGWRLPTKKELQSIVNYGYSQPQLDTAYFPIAGLQENALFWTNTSLNFLSPLALNFSFWDGQSDSVELTERYLVLPVTGRPLAFGQFKDNLDGTISDLTTGLMWTQSEAPLMTWKEALEYCEKLSAAGQSDWRLPNIRELQSLVDDSRREPSIDKTYFPGCRLSMYWSSTTYVRAPRFAWYVRFDDGRSHAGGHKARKYSVRAVRNIDYPPAR